MTKLVWGQADRVQYETGVSRGVLYPLSGPGVVWNGLINVEESALGGESTSYYFDGIKYLDVVSSQNYQATVTAFSAPEAFSPMIGENSVIPGLVLTRQPRSRFGFSYKTNIDPDIGYKIHIVYNALANPDTQGYSSTNASTTPGLLSWKINAVPPVVRNYKPSAHYVIDSTKTNADALAVLEDILYGTDEQQPTLPDIDVLLALVAFWSPLILGPEETSGLATLTAGLGDLYKTQTDGINRALPNTRLSPSPTNGVYRME